MLRFLTAGLTVIPGDWILDGSPRLRQRPVGPLVAALKRLGASIDYQEEPGFAPLRIRGEGLRGGKIVLDAGSSSQFLSALLMAAVRAGDTVEIEVEALISDPYVDLTMDALRTFGAHVARSAERRFKVDPGSIAAETVEVEGDASSACYFAAAAMLTGGKVEIVGLGRDSRQGDRRFFDLLETMGAEVRWSEAAVEVGGTGALKAVEAELSRQPDQVPTLAAIAPFAQGVTRITGVPHLRLKESDRLAAMAQELRSLGAEVEELDDGLVIPGTWAHRAPPDDEVFVDSHEDHRIAMSLSLTGLKRPGVRIRDPQVSAKSYPGYWEDLERLLSE
jgi:3-phosphoshikimate 1-carboxyvinyltransferase